MVGRAPVCQSQRDHARSSGALWVEFEQPSRYTLVVFARQFDVGGLSRLQHNPVLGVPSDRDCGSVSPAFPAIQYDFRCMGPRWKNLVQLATSESHKAVLSWLRFYGFVHLV